MTDAGSEPALMRVARAQQRLSQARDDLARAVDGARAEGASWLDVGRMLGITRQAAFKRFGHPIDPRTGREMTPRRPGSADHLRELTVEVFTHVAAGDYDALADGMAPGVGDVLTRPVVLDTWAAVVAESGGLERCTPVRLEVGGAPLADEDDVPPGLVVGHTTLECEAGSWWGRVAWDAEDRIVGLLVVPVDTERLPF